MELIETENAPLPGGHYSQAVLASGLLFISGQLAIDPASGNKVLGSIEEQAEQVLKNMESIALAAGADRNQVVKTNIYISDIDLWGRVNTVYADFFKSHKPARAIIPCRNLHHGFLIELEAVVSV